MHFSTFLSSAATFNLALAGYVLQDDYMQDFFGNFDFFTSADPTNGFVQYVDEATAQSTGLINSTSGTVSWGVDTTTESSSGRASVRISSKKTYDEGLVILDVAHMPTGCGTWPAFWMVGPDWPTNGEIDVIEGVNEQETNQMTLHTGPGCSISSSSGAFSGTVATSDCDVNAADQDKNAGCGIISTDDQSYGSGLNAVQGGIYATEWTDSAISVYFFPRSSIPDDITSGSPDPSGWGTPAATFSGDCDIATTFKQQQIVFDTTFCGDWAGAVWSTGSCASKADTCEAFVQNNPSAFTDAYWTINSLKVFQSNGATSPSGPSSVVSSAIPTIVPSIIPISSVNISQPTSVVVPSVLPSIISSVFPSVVPSIVPSVETSALLPSSTGIPAFSTGFVGGPNHSHHRHHSQTQSADNIAATTSAAIIVPSSAAILFPNATVSSFSFAGTATSAVTAVAPISGNSTTSQVAASSQSVVSSKAVVTSQAGATTAVAAPTTGGGGNNSGPMEGFQWPKEHDGQGGGAASSSGASKPSTTLLTATSAAPAASSATTAAAIPTSEVAKKLVHTVYATEYVTVAGRSAPTPAPVSNKARVVRQHRRRMTQHNAARRWLYDNTDA